MEQIVATILDKRKEIPSEQSLLVGISGIDASGKGFITARVEEELRKHALNAANINIDGWLNLPPVRFGKPRRAKNFYENAIRFEEMFERLIFPLKQNRSIDLTADFAEETATEYRKHRYFFENIDVILLEGIFLFKNEFKRLFDLKIWIECSFETALKRAIERSQENLSPVETIKAYDRIYFPAQKIHFARDNPQESVDFILQNS